MSRIDARLIRVFPGEESPDSYSPNGSASNAWLSNYKQRRQRNAFSKNASPLLTELIEAADTSDPLITSTVQATDLPSDQFTDTAGNKADADKQYNALLAANMYRQMPSTASKAVQQVKSIPSELREGVLMQLAKYIKQFCTNPAVNASGDWEMQVPIPKLLSGTTLLMTVSHFTLSLRFSITDPTVKELVCSHSDSLRQELTKLMAKSVPPRNVDIIVW